MFNAFDHGCDAYGFDIQGRCCGCGRDFDAQVSAASDAADAAMADDLQRMQEVPEMAALLNGGCIVAFVR